MSSRRKVGVTKEKIEDSHRYFNVRYKSESFRNPASIVSTLNLPLLDDPEKYHASVIRWSLPGRAVPIFVFEPLDYIVGFIYNVAGTPTELFTNFVTYVSYDQSAETTDEWYYYVYQYQQMIDMVNDAFDAAFTAFKAAHGGEPETSPPQLVLDPNTGLISLYVEQSYISGANRLDVIMNQDTLSFFQGFTTEDRLTFSPSYSRIIIQDLGTNIVEAKNPHISSSAGTWYKIPQQYPCLYAFHKVRSILLLSNSLPSAPEFNPAGADSNTLDNRNIVSDFIVTSETGTSLQSIIEYLPTAEYRLIDLLSHSPISTIDFQFNFVDFRGNVRRILLGANDEMTIKILFIKKKKYL